jgi:hypothetical protein
MARLSRHFNKEAAKMVQAGVIMLGSLKAIASLEFWGALPT